MQILSVLETDQTEQPWILYKRVGGYREEEQEKRDRTLQKSHLQVLDESYITKIDLKSLTIGPYWMIKETPSWSTMILVHRR